MPRPGGQASHSALGTRHEGSTQRRPTTGGLKRIIYNLFLQKDLCVLGVLGGEGPISSSISIRVLLIGAAVAGRKRIGTNALRRFGRCGISDRALLLSAYRERS